MTQCKEIHTTNLVRKVLTYWEAMKFIVVYASFQKCSISFENLNFIFGNKYYELSSKKLQAYFVDSEKCLPNTQFWITMICLLFIISSKNNVCGKQNNALPLAPRCPCPNLWNLNFTWQKRHRMCDSVKNFKIERLSWVIRVGLCNHKGPCEWKREAADLKTLFCWLWT